MHLPTRWALAYAVGSGALALAACSTDTTSPGTAPSASVTTTGNGAPSGAHFTLNIIGVAKGKPANMDNAGGSVIFASLGGKTGAAVTTKIELNQSAAAGVFQVLDKNGTDGTATFSLPAPGTYTVWARALGTPGGMAKITTCADAITGTTATDPICSTQNEVFVRGTKADQFRDVTTSLTTIQLDPVLHADAVTACGGTTVSLFDPCLEGYFWQYDNNGLRVLQVRFYSTAG